MIFPTANGLAVPVKRSMDIWIIDLAVGSAFEAKEARNLISLEYRTGFQVSLDIRFGNQRVVFRVNEEIIGIQALGENPLVRKRKRCRILTF